MTKGEIRRLIATNPEAVKKEIECLKAAGDAEGLEMIAAKLMAHADALRRYADIPRNRGGGAAGVRLESSASVLA